MNGNHVYFEGDKIDGVYMIIDGQMEILKTVDLKLNDESTEERKEQSPKKYLDY